MLSSSLLFTCRQQRNQSRKKYISFGLENLENWTWIFSGYFTEFKWSDNECWSEAKKPDWKLHDFSIFYRDEFLLFSFCVGNFVWYFFYNFLIFFFDTLERRDREWLYFGTGWSEDCIKTETEKLTGFYFFPFRRREVITIKWKIVCNVKHVQSQYNVYIHRTRRAREA